MQIIIGGSGKVGRTLSHDLCHEGHKVTVIDTDHAALEKALESNDLRTVEGSITSIDIQREAEVQASDIFVAATTSDEINLTASMIAKNLGAKHTMARVRDTEYAAHLAFVREKLGISYLMNPDYDTAHYLAEMLQFPAAYAMERFISGNVIMMEGELSTESKLGGHNLIDFRMQFPSLIVTAVEREDEVYIPNGTFTLEAGDRLLATGDKKELRQLYSHFANYRHKLKNIMIIGGGRTAYYLLKLLKNSGFAITLIEKNPETAERFAVEFPEVRVIVGDGTDYDILEEFSVESIDIILALTNQDEQNVMISLYASAQEVPRLVTKVNRTEILPLLDGFNLQTIVTPHHIAAEGAMRFIRARIRQEGSVEAVYHLMKNRILAIEFSVVKNSAVLGQAVQDLPFVKNTLIAFIYRQGSIIFPKGSDELKLHDRVAIITKDLNTTELDDILQK